MARIATTILFYNMLSGLSVKDTTLSRLGLIKRKPLLHEYTNLWLFFIHSRVVSKSTLCFVFPPHTRLSSSHSFIREVGKRDECRTTNTTYNYNLSNLTYNVVTLKRCQSAAMSILEKFNTESKQLIQRFWA